MAASFITLCAGSVLFVLITSCAPVISRIFLFGNKHVELITETNHPLLDTIPGYEPGMICLPDEVIETPILPDELLANPPMDSGIGTGFGARDIPGAVALGKNTFQIPPDKNIEASFHLIYPKTNINSIPLPLRVYALLDEHVVANAFHHSSGDFYDITLEPGTITTLTLNIPPLSYGVHDVIIFSITGFDLDTDPYGHFGYTDYRVSLVVGDDAKLTPRHYTTFPPLESISPAGHNAGVSLILSSNSEKPEAWSWPETRREISAGDQFEIYAFAGYDSYSEDNKTDPPQADTMALIAFMDYHPTQITGNSSVLYGMVSSDTAWASIPVELNLPSEIGPHDVMILRIPHPGLPMCLLRDPEKKSYWFPEMIVAGRVGISVIK